MLRPASESPKDIMPAQPLSADAHGLDAMSALMASGTISRPAGMQSDRSTRPGLNFAGQDYLGLAAHPAVRAAALAALGQHRLAAAGTPLCRGLTAPVLALESRVACFVGLPTAVTFPSGSDAIRATLQAVLQAGDDVIVDAGAHPAMFEAVRVARARLHRSPAGSLEAAERRLNRLSRQPGHRRLVLALPMISAFGSKMADIVELVALARHYNAILIADVTHDLGAMGQTGGGVLEIQGVTGRPDVIVGSFGKCFGAGGGFAALRDPALATVLRSGQWRTAALSPVNAVVIDAAFGLIGEAEGWRRRRHLHGNSLRLRNHLMADGLRVMGHASHLVPLRLPYATAVARTALLQSAGPLVTLLRAPTVAAHAPRWRIQLNADHSAADIDDLAELIRDVTRAFDRQPLQRKTRLLTQG
jgi:glycine C-acetyltransferase